MLIEQVVIFKRCLSVEAFDHFDVELYCLVSQELSHLCNFALSLILINQTNDWLPHCHNALECSELNVGKTLDSLGEYFHTVFDPCQLC